MHFHLSIPNDIAAMRAASRVVCISCDGGADPASARAENPTCCVVCEGTLSRRPDDTPEGFNRRWESFSARYEEFRTLLPEPLCLNGEAVFDIAPLLHVDDIEQVFTHAGCDWPTGRN